jgi:hypothetical protein
MSFEIPFKEYGATRRFLVVHIVGDALRDRRYLLPRFIIGTRWRLMRAAASDDSKH